MEHFYPVLYWLPVPAPSLVVNQSPATVFALMAVVIVVSV